MTVKSRGEHAPDPIKQMLKANINTGEIKVGGNLLNHAIEE